MFGVGGAEPLTGTLSPISLPCARLGSMKEDHWAI